MHPWMIEQLASEHRRDLLARASRRRLVKGILAGRRRARPTFGTPVAAPGSAEPIELRPAASFASSAVRGVAC